MERVCAKRRQYDAAPSGERESVDSQNGYQHMFIRVWITSQHIYLQLITITYPTLEKDVFPRFYAHNALRLSTNMWITRAFSHYYIMIFRE